MIDVTLPAIYFYNLKITPQNRNKANEKNTDPYSARPPFRCSIFTKAF